jgi:hypothetical protein
MEPAGLQGAHKWHQKNLSGRYAAFVVTKHKKIASYELGCSDEGHRPVTLAFGLTSGVCLQPP